MYIVPDCDSGPMDLISKSWCHFMLVTLEQSAVVVDALAL